MKNNFVFVLFTLIIVLALPVLKHLPSNAAGTPVLTQKLVIRDAQKAYRENVTVNEGETLSTCYIEITPSNTTNQAVTLTSSSQDIMTVAQHKGTDGKTYVDITGISTGVAMLTATALDTGKTYSLNVSVTIPLEAAEAELTKALYPKKTAQDSAASFATQCSAGQRGIILGAVGDYYFFDIPQGVLEKNYHAAYVKKSDVKVYANAVTLTPDTVTLNKGQKQKLTTTVSPSYATEKTIQFSSSNGTIASISKTGTVKAKKKGSVTITATVASKSSGAAINRTASTTVTVKLPVKRIVIKPGRLTLEQGSSRKLKAAVSPANADDAGLTYQSSNEAIATISTTGIITARKEGTAVITVKNEASGKKKSCKLTVTDTKSYELILDEELEAGNTYQVQIARKDGLKKKGNSSLSIVNPATSNEKYIFRTSNRGIAAIDKNTGKVTTYKAGTVTITMRPAGSKNTYKLSVKVKKKAENQKNMTMILKKGKKKTIMDNSQLKEQISYVSSNKKIAVVNSKGQITAKKQGTCTIRVLSKEKADEKEIKLYVYQALDKGKGVHYGFLTKAKSCIVESTNDGSRTISLTAYTKANLLGKCGKGLYYATFYDSSGKKTGKGIIPEADMLLYKSKANRNYFLTAHKDKLSNLSYANTVENLPDNNTPLQIGIVDDTVHIFVNFIYKGTDVDTCFTYKQGENTVQYDDTYREVFEQGLKEHWGNEGKIEYKGSNKEYSARMFDSAKHTYQFRTYKEKDFEEGVVLRCQVHINERCNITSHYIPVTIGGKKGSDKNYWFWTVANADDIVVNKKKTVAVYESYDPYGVNRKIVIPTNPELENNPSASKQKSYRMDIYKKTCAHEFGHMLGLDDAYKLEVDNAYEKTTIYRIEGSMLNGYYDGYCMMDNEKQVKSKFRANDLEMVLYAYNNMQSNEKRTESWQPYRTYQYKIGTNKLRVYNRSKAITWRKLK